MTNLRLLLLALLVFQARNVLASDYDFYIDFSECKITVGYLVLSNESLKTVPGDPTVMACNRKSNIVECDFIFKNKAKGIKGQSERYEVILDSPPFLYFSSEMGSEFVAIDTAKHSAVLINRIVDKTFVGSKVCQGLYATGFEVKGMKK
jgi:hypothetical protein